MIVVDLWMHLMEYLSGLLTSVPFLRAVPTSAQRLFDMFEPVIQSIYLLYADYGLSFKCHGRRFIKDKGEKNSVN